jgi:F0F1-type ATP synthase assembly protein I
VSLNAHNPSPDKKEGASGDWMRAVREAAPYLGIGTSLAATLLLGLGAGYLLDRELGTKPLCFLVGGSLGLLLALYQFFKTVSGRKP